MDPKTLRFIPTHEWVAVEGDRATIGISRFAVEQLTDLLSIELPKIGARIQEGKSFGEIESVKAVSDLYAPVSGEVVEVNAAILKDVEGLANDPYGEGWLIRVKLAESGAESAQLLDYDAYEKKVAESPH